MLKGTPEGREHAGVIIQDEIRLALKSRHMTNLTDEEEKTVVDNIMKDQRVIHAVKALIEWSDEGGADEHDETVLENIVEELRAALRGLI